MGIKLSKFYGNGVPAYRSFAGMFSRRYRRSDIATKKVEIRKTPEFRTVTLFTDLGL
jgi:hypothetical protein